MDQIVKKMRSCQSKVNISEIGEREDLVVQSLGDVLYK